ncbi:globin [Micractinium conductrix]|uniref:Globin n=1 Tax=Micractinium conductrix TaxID=554055 RepID=A0A2P6VMT3_9CHLO|nr:globin [Micractinium conductrix]|eukprot:PSC75367.1 globin [Micractinium conductrix]
MLPAIQPAVVGLDQYQDAAAAPAAALAAAERAASGALSTASTDTGPALAGDLAMLSRGTSLDGSATQEEEELSRELTQEILLEFNGLSTRPASRRSSRRVSLCSSHAASRKPSEALGAASEQGDAQAGDDAAREDGGSDGGSEGTAESDEAEPLPSLYDQLGGGVALKVVVDVLYQHVLGDPRLSPFFEGVDMSKHARKFLLFASYVLGGPDEYLQLHPEPWPQLYTVHERLIKNMGLVESHFEMVKEHFGEALQGLGATPLLIEQALSIVESTRSCLFRLDRPGSPQEQEQQEQQPAAACPFSKADAAAGSKK